MNDFEQQADQVRRHAEAMGLSGTAIVDVSPSQGFLRLKVKLSQPERLSEFMDNYARVVVMTLGMMNVQAKVHIDKEAKG